MTLFLRVPTVDNFSVVEFFVGKKSYNREKEAGKCVGEKQSWLLYQVGYFKCFTRAKQKVTVRDYARCTSCSNKHAAL